MNIMKFTISTISGNPYEKWCLIEQQQPLNGICDPPLTSYKRVTFAQRSVEIQATKKG